MIESATNWNDLQSLIRDARSGNVIDPESFARFIANDLIELDEWAGVPENTATRKPHESKLQEYMRRSLRVIEELLTIGFRPDKALFWFRNFPIAELNYKTPLMVLRDDQTDMVIATLEAEFHSPGANLSQYWEVMRQDTIYLEEELMRRVPMHDAFEVARICGIETRGMREFLLARHLGQEGTMFYFMRHRQSRFPKYQFDTTRPKPVVKGVLQFLKPYRSGYEIALWFSASNDWLDGRRPDELLDSHPRLIVDAARQNVAQLVGR